jgi:hypothetical protein
MAEKVGFEQSRESFALANPGMFVPFLLLQKQHLDVHSLHASVPEFVRQLLYSEIIFIQIYDCQNVIHRVVLLKWTSTIQIQILFACCASRSGPGPLGW